MFTKIISVANCNNSSKDDTDFKARDRGEIVLPKHIGETAGKYSDPVVPNHLQSAQPLQIV